MPRRKLLLVLSIFNASVNTLYLVRFFGILPPEEVVHGYVAWFMSFMLPNAFIALTSWVLVYALLKNTSNLAVLSGLLVSGALIFHALNGLTFGFYSGFLQEMTFDAIIEIIVYAYGLSLAAFYITQFHALVRSKTFD